MPSDPAPRDPLPGDDDRAFHVVPVPITISRSAHQRVMQLWQWFYFVGQQAVESDTPPGGIMLTVFNQLALLATQDPEIVERYVDTIAEMSPAAIGGAAVGASELRDTLRRALDATDDPPRSASDLDDPDQSAAA